MSDLIRKISVGGKISAYNFPQIENVDFRKKAVENFRI